MTATEDRLRGATRWSMGVRCPRQASYAYLGVDPEQPTSREQGRFARGRDTEDYVVRQLIAKHGEGNVIRQKAVAWPAAPSLPLGELHSDATIVPERLAVEVKASEWIDSMFDAAVLQVAGAIHFDPDVDKGVLLFVDRDYQVTDEFPVFLTDDLVFEIEEIVSAIQGVVGEPENLPARVCEKPADGRGHFCPFIEHCFQGWVRPDANEDANLSQLASEGWLILRDLRGHRGDVKDLERQWEEWKEKAIAAEVPAGETMAGSIRVKRTDVNGKQTFSRSKAVRAGVWQSLHDEVFDPFISQSEGYSTFDLIRTEANGGELDLDYGDASHLDDI